MSNAIKINKSRLSKMIRESIEKYSELQYNKFLEIKDKIEIKK
jgi:hypothetical protein